MMRGWVLFWILGTIFGSSFLLIRIGVGAVEPVQLVLLRVGMAAVGLNLVVILWRKKLPQDWQTWRALIILGIGNNAIPFMLISWAEQRIDSGLAAVFQATTALIGLVVAHYAFKDERITMQKVAGLALGFVGVVVLASRNWQSGELEASGLFGQLAMIGSSVCYATFIAYSKKILTSRTIDPIVISAIAMLAATYTQIALWIFGMWRGDLPLSVPATISGNEMMAIVGLGVLNTFVAYLIYYEVIRLLGAARSSMVTYIVPVVGVFLGVIVLNEQLDFALIGGAILIFAGIGVVNLRYFRRLNRFRFANGD